ncbi:hypothetical protein JCM8097_004560 [Rhodosporidiobolus ruineniae]
MDSPPSPLPGAFPLDLDPLDLPLVLVASASQQQQRKKRKKMSAKHRKALSMGDLALPAPPDSSGVSSPASSSALALFVPADDVSRSASPHLLPAPERTDDPPSRPISPPPRAEPKKPTLADRFPDLHFSVGGKSTLFSFDWDGGIDGAYKLLGVDQGTPDQRMREVFLQMMRNETTSTSGRNLCSDCLRPRSQPSLRLGAVLMIACSRCSQTTLSSERREWLEVVCTLYSLAMVDALQQSQLPLPCPPSAVRDFLQYIFCGPLELDFLSLDEGKGVGPGTYFSVNLRSLLDQDKDDSSDWSSSASEQDSGAATQSSTPPKLSDHKADELVKLVKAAMSDLDPNFRAMADNLNPELVGKLLETGIKVANELFPGGPSSTIARTIAEQLGLDPKKEDSESSSPTVPAPVSSPPPSTSLSTTPTETTADPPPLAPSAAPAPTLSPPIPPPPPPPTTRGILSHQRKKTVGPTPSELRLLQELERVKRELRASEEEREVLKKAQGNGAPIRLALPPPPSPPTPPSPPAHSPEDLVKLANYDACHSENAKLRSELAVLRRSSASLTQAGKPGLVGGGGGLAWREGRKSPGRVPPVAPAVDASKERTSFVVQRLAKRLEEVNARYKVKSEENLALILELGATSPSTYMPLTAVGEESDVSPSSTSLALVPT